MRTTAKWMMAVAFLTLAGATLATAEDQMNPSKTVANTADQFTAQYLEKVNAQNQAQNEEHKLARARHQRILEFYTRHR